MPAKQPETIVRVETDEGGADEARVRRSGGSLAEVMVDESFTVTSVEEHDDGPGELRSVPPAALRPSPSRGETHVRFT